MASDNIRVLGGLDLASTLSFEQNYSGFPADPKPRTLVVKEGMAYLYTELVVDSGYFTWTPIGLKQTAYLHTQGVASTTWTVTHDFGTTDFGYFVYDNNHHLVVASVTVIDENSVLINLSEAITGTAVFFSIQHVSAPNVTAVDSITINTMTLRDAIGVLTVNNNAVAMEESVASRLAQKYSTTQADAAIAAAVSAEAVLRTAADGTLSARIDSVLSNIDGTALNSLSEIVAAFQAADGTLNGAISSLGTNASSALGTEASTARAAEATLTANLASEVTNRGTAVSGAITTASGDATSKVYTETTRAIAAEATLTTNLGSEVSAARAAEATLTADLASEVTTRGTAVSGAITTAASDATAKVLTETNRATAAEGTLQGNITSEAATARAAESTLTTNLASEAATARAAESTLRADLASEVTNRGTAVSGAITTASGDATTKANAAQAAAASDATAKVLTETNRATAAEATIASNLASEITNRTSADATTLASAKTYSDAQINPTVKTYLGAFDGDIIPSANVTYNLGSPTKAFHSVYVGPGTLYVNGKAVIEDVSDTMTFTTSVDQNIRLQTSGAGHLEFQSDLGTIDIKGTLAMESGKRITSSDGVEVNFGDDIRMNSNKITLLGVPTANADAATKAYVDSMTIYDTTIIRTGGSQTVAGVMTFTDGIVAGNLTVNGTTTTINSETIKLADNLIDLNSNMVSGTPTENSGIRIMRGDEAATQLRWNEANDKWELTNDGSVYSNISTAADLSAEAATARAAESTLTSNLASEVTNRGTAVSGAITTASGDATTKANAAQAAAASDATAKVLTETNRATAAESTLTTDLASEVTNRGTAVSGAITTASGDATTKANAAQAAAASDATAKVLTETNARTAADATLATNLASEAATARAAEATLATNLATEVTNRGTAVSGAITTASGDATTKANAAQAAAIAAAASDATAKVLTETNARTAAESTLTTNLASEVTNRGTAVSGAITTASGDATTKANAAQAAAIAASAPVAHVGAGGTAHANAVAAGAAGFMTGADKTKLDGIAAGATNVTNTNQITNGSGYVTASVVLTTAAQPNITSVGALTSLSTTGDVTVGGNLTVSGTTTTINATTLDVADINITIAKNAASAAAANGAGLTVNGAAATLQYLSGTDTWNFNKTVVANITGNVSGSAATITGVYGGSLTSAQVTTALTYTPYNSSNPSGYTTNVGTVTGVTATGPVVSSGGTAPVISMAAATASVPGYLTAADWSTFNGKQAAGSYQVAGTYVNTVNGNSGTVTAAHISAAATAGYGYTPYNAASIGSASVNYAASAGSAPASDVYAWAKAATKPAYNSTEVGLGNVNNTADSAKSVSYAATAGSAGSVTGGTVSTTSITTGGSSTAGTIVGNWSLGTGSKLNATYADLAEKYEADAEYEAGTVLEFGGDKEVSLATDGTGTRVAGVVSTNPAYVMNNECAGEHVAVLALQGRVPCKVIGPVQKGDLMVAARNGFACANNEARSGTIIGKALANFDGESGVIEVVVGRF